MIESTVAATGFVLEVGEDGYYQLTHWTRQRGAQGSFTVVYSGLTYAEALDVIYQCALDSRPGWVIGAGWRMQPLFGPGSDQD